MKKIVLFLLLFLGFNMNVFASTKTYERTKDNLLVPDNIKVTDDNINYILNTKAVNASEKIYDYAYIISDKEEKQLYKTIDEFVKKTKIDLVIITENNLNNPAAYAFNFYDYNFFDKEGLIFLVNKNADKYNIYMWTCGNVIDIYTEKRIEDILTYVYSFFKKKDYYGGVKSFVDVVYGFYKADNNIGSNVKINEEGKVVKNIPWIIIITISSIFTFIISYLLFFRKKTHLNYYLSDNNLNLIKLEDQYLGREIIKKQIR